MCRPNNYSQDIAGNTSFRIRNIANNCMHDYYIDLRLWQ